MEEHVDQDGGQAVPVVDDNTALLNVNNDELSRGNKRCTRGCSRAVHCCLALPFLAIIALVIISVACFYNNQDHVGGCVLFGKIDLEDEGLFKHGPNAVCLTVTGGEMVLCAFAILYAIVLVVKAFLSSRLLTWFVFLELFLLFLLFLISIGISSTMHIGISSTCVSIHPGSPTPGWSKCGDIKVNTDKNLNKEHKHPVWDSVLQESLVASWICTLIYMVLVFVWVMLSLFTCCAFQSRKRHQGRQCQVNCNAKDGMPIMREPNVVYGAT